MQTIKELQKLIPDQVTLVAASKTRSADEILTVVDQGIGIIGENYVQEANGKFQDLKGKVKIHLIGHLQSNKVKSAVEIFDMIQSVDSIKLAIEINKRSTAINKVMPILIEINSGKEANKTGVLPQQAKDLIKQCSNLKNIKIKGLMTMAPQTNNPEDARLYYQETKQLFDSIKKENIPSVEMDILSMGMSDSYKVAIEEGATMVRIGSLIFGKRK